MTERSAPRVVLLAREGEARTRLGDALAQAGADTVLVADPVSSDPGEAIASNPQAVLVALEPAVEDALERFDRSEEHTSELQSLMRISYAVFCLKKKKIKTTARKTY